MKHSGYVSADFDTHPGAAVVINPIGAVLRISGSEGIANHGVPFVVEITPRLAVLIGPAKSNENRAHRASSSRKWTFCAGHHHRYAIEMINHHLIGKKFAVEEP